MTTIKQIIDDSAWTRKQLFPRWKKRNSNTWETTAWGCRVEVYWNRCKGGGSYTIDGSEYHVMEGYLLRDIKTRAVGMAQQVWKRSQPP